MARKGEHLLPAYSSTGLSIFWILFSKCSPPVMAELQPPEGQINGGALLVSPTVNVATKRQRRPSVRLGDIGDQTYDPHGRRRTKQWKAPMNEAGVGVGGGKSSRTRAIMNFASSSDNHEALDGEDKEGYMDSVAVGSWKIRDSKSKRASTKRVRSNWAPKVDETGGGTNEGEEKYSGGEDVDDGFRDFDVDGSESPLKEQSPIHTLDNMAIDIDRADLHRRGVGATRVSEVRDHQDELEGPSDTDTRNWINPERNGVRVWLNQLGLGRYAPVFEIHEVDDEVLPMLTIEDLKDMGINAVGSRRKMYCSIQKLSKGFS